MKVLNHSYQSHVPSGKCWVSICWSALLAWQCSTSWCLKPFLQLCIQAWQLLCLPVKITYSLLLASFSGPITTVTNHHTLGGLFNTNWLYYSSVNHKSGGGLIQPKSCWKQVVFLSEGSREKSIFCLYEFLAQFNSLGL